MIHFCLCFTIDSKNQCLIMFMTLKKFNEYKASIENFSKTAIFKILRVEKRSILSLFVRVRIPSIYFRIERFQIHYQIKGMEISSPIYV